MPAGINSSSSVVMFSYFKASNFSESLFRMKNAAHEVIHGVKLKK